MATAEAASGPRYAPDDPTLPKPWKGLIDGSTGVLYYWNPETNITQYEKPASLPPPLPPGLPPATTTPKMAAIPVAHSNGVVPQEGQQVSQYPQQHGHLMGQQMPSYSQQQSSQMPLAGHQQSSQLGQAMQQHGQVSLTPQHMMQHPSQQMMQHPSQQIPPASAQQAGQHIPHQLGQQAPPSQNSQMPQAQVHQYSHQQQLQYMAYQQSSLPQGQQSSQQQTPHGQALANQQSAYPPREEHDFQHRNQSGFSPSQFQQVGASSVQNLPTGTSSVQMPPRAVHPSQPQQFGGSLGNMQQPSSFGHQQQSGTDLVHHQHGSRFQNQMDPAIIHSQQPNMPPIGLRRSHENNFQGRVGNEYYLNGNNEGPTATQQPKLAAIPMTIARSQQEMGISGVPFQNAAPGQGMHNMYSHATGGPPFSNNALVKPSYVGPTSVPSLSPVQAYLQQHEVTATGGNVPAPFMTFEDTGFPPEILRDVRYLLRRWSICRTLHCYWHTYTCNNYSHFWRLQNELLEPFLCIF